MKKNYKTNKLKKDFASKDAEDQKINSSQEKPVVNKERLPKCNIINDRLNDNETISELKQSFSSVESKYKLFSDNDETESLEEESSIHMEDLINDELLEDIEVEKTIVNKVNDQVLQSTKVENFIKTEDIQINGCKRKISTDTLIEEEKYVILSSLSECKSILSEETMTSTDSHCPSKDFEPSSESDNKVELCSSTTSDINSSIGFGFYVNRDNEESVSVPSLPEISKLECSAISKITNPDDTTEISSTESSVPDKNSLLHMDEVPEGIYFKFT